MKYLFDLQLFAEEEQIENTDAEQVEEQQAEQTDQAEQDKTEEKKEIPPELAGVSEDIARQILVESGGKKEQESSTADADSDTKQVEEGAATDEPLEQPHNPIPYTRFKEVNDQVKSLKEELEKLKKNGETKPAEQAQQTSAPVASVQTSQSAQPAFRITPEVIEKINTVAAAEAMSMTGLTKEDIDAFEYSDDNDQKKQLWSNALNIAKNKTIFAITQEAERQKTVQTHFIAQHTKSVEDFNNFYKQQSAENDFKDIQNHAVNDYFTGLPTDDQSIISGAYGRIQRNTASPQDIFCIKKYFDDAKSDYRSKHPVDKKPDVTIDKTKEKLKEMEKHPKSEQINGTTTAQGGKITPAKLEKMLNTMPWEKIPDEYKKMLLGE